MQKKIDRLTETQKALGMDISVKKIKAILMNKTEKSKVMQMYIAIDKVALKQVMRFEYRGYKKQ